MTQVGIVAGIQLMQTLQVSTEEGLGLVGSFHAAYWLGGAVSVLGVVAATFVRRSDTSAEAEGTEPSDVPVVAGRPERVTLRT